jgi:UDP-GlcNAc:undecaprenyl-phosphate/decaprenyl-phosphate GlcNAc-1-phosphate transferase
MFSSFIQTLHSVAFETGCLFIIFAIISFYWKKIYVFFSLKPYQSKQRLHQDEVPRIAGLMIYIFLTVVALFSIQSHLLNVILISALPIILIGSKEDLFYNTSPKLRLIMMTISAGLLIHLLPTKLPEIDFPLINQILSIGFMKEIFFIFSILVIINGNNLIDGVNGNLALTNIVQLISVGLLAFVVSDDVIVQLSCILLIALIPFTLFNFPFGKVFCGDAGAYFYGFAISASVIYLFGTYDDLLSWNAILILIYPSIELLFSFIRKKIFENKSPFIADTKHLHSLIYRYINKQNLRHSNNSVVILYLLPFILGSLLSCYFYEDIFTVLLIIFLLFSIYIMMYLYLLNKLLKQ